MFADSLLESAWAHDSRRGWTTALSFAIQGVAVAGLLLLPLIYGEKLPGVLWIQPIVAPMPLPAPIAPDEIHRSSAVSNLSSDGHMIPPTSIPDHIEPVEESVPPMPVGAAYGAVGATDRSSARDGVMHSILSVMSSVLPPPTHPTIARPTVTSHMMEGYLVHKVQPEYPPLARQARIQGAVVLQAIISRTGTIENLQVLSGHPMLIPSALAAVRQWRYRPYYLNGESVEVETQVTVNFVLGGG